MTAHDETKAIGGGDHSHNHNHNHNKPKSYTFFVNGTKYETDQSSLTGLQIKARVADWDQSHDLVLEGRGNDPDRVIRDDEVVELEKEHGPLRFSSVPKANFG